MLFFTMILGLYAGIGRVCLALTDKKPTEYQRGWLRRMKNLWKIFFCSPIASGDPGGTIGLTTPEKLLTTECSFSHLSGR